MRWADDDKPLRDILSKYPRAMLFTGHGQWVLDSAYNIYQPANELPIYLFNTASVAYLWTDNDQLNKGHSLYKENSQYGEVRDFM